MAHLLVEQLRFARSELARCLAGVSEEDAQRRLGPMNCLSWIVGHLATQENAYWVLIAQGEKIAPGLHKVAGHGSAPSTPPLAEMWTAWREVTAAADRYLDTLTPQQMTTHLTWKGEQRPENIGTMLLRTIYHYWFHIGEAHAIRQQLGHRDLPEFVGDMSAATYRLE